MCFYFCCYFCRKNGCVVEKNEGIKNNDDEDQVGGESVPGIDKAAVIKKITEMSLFLNSLRMQ